MNRLHYVIGDIHGCFAELIEMERRLRDHATNHKSEPIFFCVGDYIDRGIQIREVVEHLFSSQSADSYCLIVGNHEAMMMDALFALFPKLFYSAPPEYLSHPLKASQQKQLGLSLLDHWYTQGGDRTARALFGSLSPDQWSIPESIINKFAQLRLLATAPRDTIITHALATDDEVQYYEQLSGDRSSPLWDQVLYGLLWRRGRPSFFSSHRLHISGHTPLSEPLYRPDLHRLLLDTGCVYGNGLSAFCIETEEFFFVPARQRYW